MFWEAGIMNLQDPRGFPDPVPGKFRGYQISSSHSAVSATEIPGSKIRKFMKTESTSENHKLNSSTDYKVVGSRNS